MKKGTLTVSVVFVVFCLLATVPTNASGADVAAKPDIASLKREKSRLLDAMDALEKEFNLNEAKGPRLKQRKSDLEWSGQVVKKEIAKWKAAKARLQTKVDNYKADVARHNSRCDRTVDTQSEYDQCVRSKAALDSRKATLGGEIQYNNEQRARVQGLIDNQKKQEQTLQREIDAYLAHRQELIDAGNRIKARLNEIQPYLNSCEEAIAAYDRS
ncbi:MAG: hypothetical protein JRJ31_21690, partial [Deltaproteobacteria bacterium]|nr:hypothetical protein [Deltaproteobacteria bacterium]